MTMKGKNLYLGSTILFWLKCKPLMISTEWYQLPPPHVRSSTRTQEASEAWIGCLYGHYLEMLLRGSILEIQHWPYGTMVGRGAVPTHHGQQHITQLRLPKEEQKMASSLSNLRLKWNIENTSNAVSTCGYERYESNAE
mmetsp:Transcript_27885/g.44921  ORF Transcript_27885/g.44921 Transcript_27885/m.44921 type:complete len:139 (-) Transcript_27885:912-1328(-)